jgi:hypothetical protein
MYMTEIVLAGRSFFEKLFGQKADNQDISDTTEDKVIPNVSEKVSEHEYPVQEEFSMTGIVGNSLMLDICYGIGEFVMFRSSGGEDRYLVIAYLVEGASLTVKYRISHPHMGFMDVDEIEIELYDPAQNI